jgi:hypothetical protein
MTDAYIATSPTADPDVFQVTANALTVGHLRRAKSEGWQLESVAPLIFGTVDLERDLEPDEAQRAAIDWLGTYQSDELDELFD